MSNVYLNATVNGLQEYDFTATDAGNYRIRGSLQLPRLIAPTATQGAGGGAGTGTGGGPAIPSQVVTVVKLNSTTKLTSNAGDQGFGVDISGVAVNDVIKIIFSSSLAQDQQPEAVQATISISEI